MHKYIYIYICTYVCMSVCVSVCLSVCMHACMHAHVCNILAACGYINRGSIQSMGMSTVNIVKQVRWRNNHNLVNSGGLNEEVNVERLF